MGSYISEENEELKGKVMMEQEVIKDVSHEKILVQEKQSI